MTITDYCPNCDKRLTIIDEDHYYMIQDNGHNITNCPDCMIPLRVDHGVIVEDK